MSNKQFILTLRPKRGVDATQALRRALKIIGRYGLHCTEAKTVDTKPEPTATESEISNAKA